MVKTPQQLLDTINDEISNLVSGSIASASEADRAFAKHRLSDLRSLRSDLLSEVAASNRQIFSPITRVNL